MMTKYDQLMSDPEFRREMAIETAVAEAAELIAQLMAAKDLSKADVARQLNKSRAWVTQLLNGKANMTIRTLAEVVYALGGELRLSGAAAKESTGGRREGWRPIAGEPIPFATVHTQGGFRLPAAPPTGEKPDWEEYAA